MPAIDGRDAAARLSAVLSALLLLLQVAVAMRGPSGLALVVAGAFAVGVAAFVLRPSTAHWPLRLLLVGLLAISLGSPTDAWDSRSIWMFHAKRMFTDGTLFAQLDHYASWSHNDYPLLVPALSSTIGAAIGGWNEIAPKSAAVLAMAPALLLVASKLRTAASMLLFALLLTFFAGTELVNGQMDALLALNSSAVVLAAMAFAGARSVDGGPRSVGVGVDAASSILAALVLAATIPLVKNEGLLVLLVLAVVFVAIPSTRGRCARSTAAAALLVFAPAAAWQLALLLAGIRNDLVRGGTAVKLLERCMDGSSHALVLEHLGKPAVLTAAMIVVAWRWSPRRGGTEAAAAFAAIYLACLYATYLATPYDLQWHLTTSASRTTLLPLVVGAACLAAALDRETRDREVVATTGTPGV
jgi:hypothetical protein